jgi:hypothetical protein
MISQPGGTTGTPTVLILDIKSPRPSVTSKKNFSPVIVAVSVIGEVPRLTRYKRHRMRRDLMLCPVPSSARAIQSPFAPAGDSVG